MQRRTKAKHNRAPVSRLIPGAALAIVEAGKATRFQPGQSGNPSGRTSYRVLSTAYKAQLARQLDSETAVALGIPLDSTIAEGIAVILARNALCGDTRAAQELADRTEGRASQFLGIAMASRPKVEYDIRVVTDPPKFPVAPDKQKLLDDLLGVMQKEPDMAIVKAVAVLTRLLRQRYGTAKP